MADFEEAYKKAMEKQGETVFVDSDNDDKVLLCSNCFKDEGLKINSISIGIENNEVCPNCKSIDGYKLTKKTILRLCYIFFVRGTIKRCEYGGFPLIQFNNHHFNNSDVNVSQWLKDDIELIENSVQVGFFYYGPRFWMFGENEPLKALQIEAEREKIIEKILASYPTRELLETEYFYRIRVNPTLPYEFSEYDSAPDAFLGKNRFDDIDFPILYGSPDLELCLHECRVSAEDNLYVAKLVPTRPLKLLDITTLIKENKTEFESLDIAIHFLFLAGKHSYSICRSIAKKIQEKGYDGLIYPSHFSYLRTGAIPFETIYGLSIRVIQDLQDYAQSQSVPNLILFGRPIKTNIINVDCINKIVINRISYDVTFGPVSIENFDKDEYVEKKDAEYTKKLTDLLK